MTIPTWAAAYVAAPARIGAVYNNECDQTIRVWFPDGVEEMKSRVAPYFDLTDKAVDACPSLPANERGSWKIFVANWRQFRARETGFLSAGADAITACGYIKQLDSFREKLAKYCDVPGGEIKPTPTPSEQFASVVKYAAIGVGVVSVAALILTFAPQLKALLPSRR